MRPRVVVTRRLPEEVEARLAESFDAVLNPDDRPLGPDGLSEAIRTADALVPTVTDRLTAEVLAAAPRRARILANFGVGLDHVDLVAAAANGLVVTNTPGVLTDDTADLAMTLLLMAARRAGEAVAILQDVQGPRIRIGRLPEAGVTLDAAAGIEGRLSG